MYIRNRPVYYSCGEQVIPVYYTAHARDLEACGWTLVTDQPELAETPQEEVPSEAILSDTDLRSLTKAELLSYAEASGVSVKTNATKGEIVEAIEAEENG